MVNVCPTEGDPRLTVGEFIRNDSVKAIAGLRDEGADTLLKIVKDEIAKQFPKDIILVVDRDLLADEKVLFHKEPREAVLRNCVAGKVNRILIAGDLSVIGWQQAFIGLPADLHAKIYYLSLACRQVPMCSKL